MNEQAQAKTQSQAPGKTPGPVDARTPLVPVLVFSFLNSIGSAVAYSGLFSLAKFQYGFGRTENFLLALLFGVMYIPAAMGVGAILKRMPAQTRLLNHRGMLLGMMFALGVLCWIPGLVWSAEGDGPHHAWPLWLVCAVYSPVAGMMWPIVESYVSGGRRAGELRMAIGRFNISWSSALVITLFAMAPLVERSTLLLLNILGTVQVVTSVVLIWFKPRPGAHEHDPELPAGGVVETDVACPHCHASLRGASVSAACPTCGSPVSDAFHLPHPPVYSKLLAALQILLPVAFLGISTLAPSLTIAFGRLGIPPAWETPMIACWMVARVATFASMERWHAWHGRWSTPIVGIALLIASLALVVLAPVLLTGTFGIAALIVGLLGFGVGVGMIYAATLYYSMEVGSAQVEASGLFETLIGVGYTLGPLCGLAGALAVSKAGATDAAGEWITLAMVGALSLLGVGVAVFRVRR